VAGLVISYEEYHPYGTTAYWSASSAVEVSRKRYRYTGKERDEETGLYYHGARYYAPWLGRWTAPDPAGMVDGVSLYAYGRNAPSVHNDPSGKQGIPLPDLLQEFSKGLGRVIEFFIGGKTETVGSGANGVVYKPSTIPYGGGVSGGIVQATTLRLWPQEPDPTPASRAGLDAGASFVTVLDPAARLVTGKTVSKAPASRPAAAVELALQIIPALAEAGAGVPKEPSLEQQLVDVARKGTATHVDLLPPEVKKFQLPSAEALARRAAPPGAEGILGMEKPPQGAPGTPPSGGAESPTSEAVSKGLPPEGMIYRGLHAEHPAMKAGLQGRVTPANIHGTTTPELHNLGIGITDSPFTAWTRSLKIAIIHSEKAGPGGVILAVPEGAPPPGATWHWEWSPDEFGESEVLLHGTREGAGVYRK
jgi:RHS repeat-associated protein